MPSRQDASTPSHVVAKRDRVLAALAQGIHWSCLGGRRLRENRRLITFKCGGGWRLLWNAETATSQLMTHNTYDKKLKKQVMK